MDEINNFNQQIIEEFRANSGKVGGPFEGATMLVLHTVGRKSGAERLNPLAYQALDGGWAIFGSKAGATSHPDWYYNLVADPNVSVEVGTETVDVFARELDGDEREAVWSQQKADSPVFAGYEQSAARRKIPVIALTPR